VNIPADTLRSAASLAPIHPARTDWAAGVI
jgi:hypothetical protein